MDLIVPFDIALALAAAASLAIVSIAANRLIALMRKQPVNDNREENDEAGLRDVREDDDPRA